MQDDIAAALRKMLGPAVGIGVTDPRDAGDDVWPAEREAVARAVPKRQCEFAAGRRAARQAMAGLDLPPEAIPVGQQRAPIWPEGTCGSIAHCDTLCIAALSQTHRSLGIDIEPATPLADDLIPIICTRLERRWLEELPDADVGETAKRIFCAKEAVYKAQYPISGQVIGFDALSIRFGRFNTFDVILHDLLHRMPHLHGKVCSQNDMIIATVAL